MKFKATTISPKGRNKYGNYLSASNITGNVINTVYSGNGSTTGIGGDNNKDDDKPKKSFLIFLSKTSNSFDGESISLQAQTDTTKVIGYCDTYVADTYIGEPTGSWTTDEDGNTTWTEGTPQVNYSITGIPTNGMTVTVTNNGTRQTAINITVDSSISANSGTLSIPVRVYLAGDYYSDSYESIGDDESEWVAVKDDCVVMSLEYSWGVTSSASSPYTMVLTNDSAAINCDSDGNILSGAIKPTCTAQLYYGTELVSGVTYGLSTYSSQNVTGLSIDTETGVLTFGSNFSFTGTPLEITITASKGGKTLGRKIMTITKNFPGAKGQDGTNGKDGKDGVNGKDGKDGTSVTIKGTLETVSELPTSGNTNGDGYIIGSDLWVFTGTEIEDTTHHNGFTNVGAIKGEDGKDAIQYYFHRAWCNTPDNSDNSFTVSNPNGNAYAYLGTKTDTVKEDSTDFNYYDWTYIKGDDGKDAHSPYIGTNGNWYFYDDATQQYKDSGRSATGDDGHSPYVGSNGNWYEYNASTGQYEDTGLKAKGTDGKDGSDGSDGKDAVTYWLQLSATTVKYNPNTGVLAPTTITAKVMKQVGENEPVEDNSYTIYYGYNTATPNTVYTGAVTVNSSYSYITFGLKNSSNKFFETQTVTILSDGNDGKDGQDGKDGTDGKDGESVYNLLLSNQSASINADSNGNILTGAVRPTCTASLYYGQTKVTNATYSISTTATGVGINSTTGVLTFNAGNAATPFSFSGTSVEITIIATYASKQYKAIMTISKSIAGKDGEGVTIMSTSTTYATTADSIQPSDGTFVYDSIPYLSIGSYLWSKTIVVYSDNSSTKSYSVSRIGSDGLNGSNGSNGKTTHFAYSTSADGRSNFSTTIFEGATYIGTYDDDNTADSTDYTKYTWTKLKGDDGTDVTITSTSVQYQIGSSGTEVPTGSWSDSVVSATDSQPYLWTKTVVVYSDGESTTAYSVSFKGKDGQDGKDAISYWLILSATSVQVDVNNSNKCTPDTITATAYKQVGESTPVLASDCTIKYGYNVSVPSVTYTGAITVDASKSFLTFMLLNADGKQVDIQTIQILKNGRNGTNGLKGASIRGPVDWYSQTSTRRFCNGVYNVDYPEDSQWIDIILKDNVYYYCNTSYTGSSNDTWSGVSANWTVADNQFNFVATQVLLADNGKIKFLSSNQMTMLSDDGNTVVAGMSGGDGVNIWAGSNEPDTAPFKVDYNGTVTATKGTFGCLTIGSETVGDVDSDVLQGTSNLVDFGTYKTALSPRALKFTGTVNQKTTYVNISTTYGVSDISDADGQVESVVKSSDDVGFYTNGNVDANQIRKLSDFTNTKQIYLYNPWTYVQGLKMMICFDDELKVTQNTTTKTWLCCGIDTGISYVEFPYNAKVAQTSIQVPYTYVDDGKTQTAYKTLNVNSQYLGYWIFYGLNIDNVPVYTFSGFGSSLLTSSQKKADTIYLQV